MNTVHTHIRKDELLVLPGPSSVVNGPPEAVVYQAARDFIPMDVAKAYDAITPTAGDNVADPEHFVQWMMAEGYVQPSPLPTTLGSPWMCLAEIVIAKCYPRNEQYHAENDRTVYGRSIQTDHRGDLKTGR